LEVSPSLCSDLSEILVAYALQLQCSVRCFCRLHILSMDIHPGIRISSACRVNFIRPWMHKYKGLG
jgi:hypothetical protein